MTKDETHLSAAEAAAPDRPVATGAAPRLNERVAAILAANIADGSLAAGSRLLESHVAARFQISRAPVRQALARLAADGLIARAQGPGYVVAGAPAAPTAMADPALPDPEPLAVEASWERIYKEVESEIVARTAFASWRVVEADLARYYGVSRTVARDVIARLQQRGIVKRDQRVRWYAPGLTRDYVAELYELRWVLEPAALLNAAPAVPAGFIRAMLGRLEEALAHAETLDGAALDALEADMHVRLLDHCGNRTLMEALGLYQSLLIAHSFLYRWAPRLYPVEPFLPEHILIAERLAAGHVGEAARALEDHLRISLDRAVARIDVVAGEFEPTPLPYLVPLATVRR